MGKQQPALAPPPPQAQQEDGEEEAWVSTNGSDGQPDASGTAPEASSSQTAGQTPTEGGTECVTWRLHVALRKMVTTGRY